MTRRRTARVAPVLVVLLAGGLLLAHGTTWSLTLAVLLGVGGLMAATNQFGTRRLGRPARTGRGLLLLAGAVLTFGGAWVAAAHGWLALVGHDTTGTVTATRTVCESGRYGCVDHHFLTLQAGDGATVHLDLTSHGYLRPGVVVPLHRDPTGLVASRLDADSELPLAVLGLVAVLVGGGLLVGLAWQVPRTTAAAVPTSTGP